MVRKLRAFLTKRPGGAYCLYRKHPIIKTVGFTNVEDVYFEPGDPLGVTNINPEFVAYLTDVQYLVPCKPVRVLLIGTRQVTFDESNFLLSRKQIGLYILTTSMPVKVGDNVYIAPGDDRSMDFICKWFVGYMFDVHDLEVGETIPVKLTGKQISIR